MELDFLAGATAPKEIFGTRNHARPKDGKMAYLG